METGFGFGFLLVVEDGCWLLGMSCFGAAGDLIPIIFLSSRTAAFLGSYRSRISRYVFAFGTSFRILCAIIKLMIAGE